MKEDARVCRQTRGGLALVPAAGAITHLRMVPFGSKARVQVYKVFLVGRWLQGVNSVAQRILFQ
jgi:hypothetical protein